MHHRLAIELKDSRRREKREPREGSEKNDITGNFQGWQGDMSRHGKDPLRREQGK